jgi:hypothetical protein
MKIRITGRLGEPVQRGATMVTSMRCQTAKAPSRLPDELPALPDMSVTYTILISPRHWRTVVDRQAEYALDGICLYDAELKGIVVMATSIKPWQRIQRDKR